MVLSPEWDCSPKLKREKTSAGKPSHSTLEREPNAPFAVVTPCSEHYCPPSLPPSPAPPFPGTGVHFVYPRETRNKKNGVGCSGSGNNQTLMNMLHDFREQAAKARQEAAAAQDENKELKVKIEQVGVLFFLPI